MDWDGRIDREIDCEGLLCPLPVLRAAKVLRGMAPGAVLRVRATDRMAAIDLPHFCVQAGHVFLSAEEQDDVGIYLIQRGVGQAE
jgi:tRNA 2-thiouridine synthesizing protein A